MLFVDFGNEIVFNSIEGAISFSEIDFDEFGHGSFLEACQKTLFVELIKSRIELLLEIIFFLGLDLRLLCFHGGRMIRE